MMASKAKRYCSESCASIAIWNRPGYRDRLSAALKGNPAFKSDARRKQLDAARMLRKPVNDDKRRKLKAARRGRQYTKFMTSIEIKLRDAMLARGLSFEVHRPMFNGSMPDFVFEKERILVQADGDYWHRRPEVAARDMRFGERAASEGWRVMRFWESEINASPEHCADLIQAALATEPLPPA